MKVLHINKSDIYGGAAIAAYRLHKGLNKAGLISQMLVGNKLSSDYTVLGPTTKFNKIWSRLVPKLDTLPYRLLKTKNLGFLSSALFPDFLLEKIIKLKPDIINLHWVGQGFMRIETLPKIAITPVVWTLHDMWPFCGGEHYAGNSLRYKDKYSILTRPKDEVGLDINRWIWERKVRAWKKINNLTIVTPSKWLAICTQNSVLFSNYNVRVIPNGLEHKLFKPIEHSLVRSILGLPDKKKLLLFCAISATSDRRKGFQFLQPALLKLFNLIKEDIEFIILGSSEQENPLKFPCKTHYMGYLGDEISRALLYAAADVFIAPSMEDNLPNTILEALSCGTPCVAFNIGGMPDMIDHKQNGYLAKPFEIDDLVQGIKFILGEQERWNRLSKNARKKIEREFTSTLQAKRYIKLYKEILQ